MSSFPRSALRAGRLLLVAGGVWLTGCVGARNEVFSSGAGESPGPAVQRFEWALDERVADDLSRIFGDVRSLDGGEVYDARPEGRRADPGSLAIAVASVDGRVWSIGDVDVVFPLQSASKPFTLARVLEDGRSALVLGRVGMHATGFRFDSLAAGEIRETPLQNPMVSAGAIATTSLVEGADDADRWSRTLRLLSACAGRELRVMDDVYAAELVSSDGSYAKAYALSSSGMLNEEPRAVVARYLRACSTGVTVEDLALMGATLAGGGVHPIERERVMSRATARGVMCAMLTAGMYDFSGPWFYRVGLPAKSGVSGCVLAVCPGRLAIAAYSPPLDEYGNSVRAMEAVARLAEAWGLHMIGADLP